MKKHLETITRDTDVLAKRAGLSPTEAEKALQLLVDQGEAEVRTTAGGKKYWRLKLKK